jgi:hypothetical protein
VNVLSGLSKVFHVSNATGIAVGVAAGVGRTVGVGGGTSVMGTAVGITVTPKGRGIVGAATGAGVFIGVSARHAAKMNTKHIKGK